MAVVSRLAVVLIPENSSVDTWITNESYLDAEVYQLWLDGYHVEDISSHPSLVNYLDDAPDSKQILRSYAADQIRSYHMLERWLYYPAELADQPVFQLTDTCRALLLERYYAFDRKFIREILGKKITHKSKKAFEEVSQKTGTKLNSCYRQHENLRRVFKATTAAPGITVINIQDTFLLSETLARDYACVAFMSLYKFDVSSRKLVDYTFDDFAFCAGEIMKGWTTHFYVLPGIGQSTSQKTASNDPLPPSADGSSDLRIDRDFFYSMKEFRFLLEKETADNLRRAICRNLPANIVNEATPEVIREVTRTMLSIALNVHHSKQFRLIFADIVEKLFYVWRSWRGEVAVSFLSVFLKSAEELNEFKSRDPRLASMWRRFFTVFNACTIRLHRDSTTKEITVKPTVKFET